MKPLDMNVWKCACDMGASAINVCPAYDNKVVWFFPQSHQFVVLDKSAGVHDLAHAFLSLDIGARFAVSLVEQVEAAK